MGKRTSESDYRDYQADIHFALATIIQGITIAFLGTAFADLIKSPGWPKTGFLLLTSLESLVLAISFWYAFVMAYFHRFRMIRMTAVDHLVLAYIYFSIGLMQIVGFQFLEEPRLWLTINCVFAATTLFYAWYVNLMARREKQISSKYLDIRPIFKVLIAALAITVVSLVLWYVWPVLDSSLYAFVCLLIFTVIIVVYNVVAVRLFQFRLNHPTPVNDSRQRKTGD